LADYDWLIDIEQKIENLLPDSAEVDGHDMGSDEMNLFIVAESPNDAFERILSSLPELKTRPGYRAAFRDSYGSSNYTVLWPEGVTHFSVN
jgi:hypothetical protein